jgi:5-methylthioadenosine/S-adenosylhomocysteine deaminase
MNWLIRDVLIVPPLREMPFDGWVEIDRIAAVGRGRRGPGAGQAVIEGGGSALIPGLVNTHAHSHWSLTRGSAEGMTLENWLLAIQCEQPQLTDEQTYVGALATYAEALLSGTTTIVDMCVRPEPARPKSASRWRTDGSAKVSTDRGMKAGDEILGQALGL